MEPVFTTINTPHDPINNVGIIRNEFDNTLDKTIYNSDNIYENLHKEFKKIITDKNKTYVNISTDRAISSASISALNELFMYQNGKIYSSDLKIIYIDSKFDLNLNNYDSENKMTNYDYRVSVVSNLLTKSLDNEISRSYTKHSLPLELNQFTFLGIDDIQPYEENILLEGNISYYLFNKLNKNLEVILDKILNLIESKPVCIIFDMSVFDSNIAPCVIRDEKKNRHIGINLDQLNIILEKFNKMNNLYNNVKMIDIVGHYLSIKDTEPAFRITIETITKIYSKILNLKQYSINIFNEHTRFLIYKPIDELCIETDDIGDNYGWYILRNVPLDMKNDILSRIDNDSIIILDIEDNVQIMVSSTTIYEQNEKCYYTATSCKDCTLYPDEKMAMMFELVNC